MLGLASGPWTVTVEAEGFGPNVTTVPIRFGSNPPIGFEMARILHPLELALGAAALEGLDPDAIQAEFEAADAAFNRAQWKQAVTAYRSVLTKLPMMNALHMNIGHALRQQRQFDEAIASFERAVAGNPELAREVESRRRTGAGHAGRAALGTLLQDPLSTAGHNYGHVSTGAASRLAALLVGQMLPAFFLLAPGDPGASPPEYVTVIVTGRT